MFTGIIQGVGVVDSVEPSSGGGRIFIRKPEGFLPNASTGESVGIQGVCLSLADLVGEVVRFDVLAETFARTSLGGLTAGSRVNLERALRYGDALGGHIVSGHVDGVGRVLRIDPVGRDIRVEIAAPSEIMRTLVLKGSVACDGISLTVAEVLAGSFAVHIIPLTREHTTWGGLKVGDAVNLESDVLGKIALKLLAGKLPGGVAPLTWDDLRGLSAAP
jgi:riboflavin synthase